MDFGTWIILFFVIIFMIAYSFNAFKPILKFRKVKDRVVKVEGTVVSIYGEEMLKKGKQMLPSYYLQYECIVDGIKYKCNGLVKYRSDSKRVIGENVIIYFAKESGELWNEREFPLLAKQIMINLATVSVLLTAMILISILL